MKILCFIDSLGSGGAQRQLVELAIGFKEKGHEVSFLVYHDEPFFLPRLNEFEIPYHIISSKNYLDRIFKIRKFIRSNDYQVVLSFLEAANFMATLAGLPFRKWKLIVGERSANPNIKKSLKLKMYRWFHLFPDYIVGNSIENMRIVKSVNPFIPDRKCKVIYNAIDLNVWKPQKDHIFYNNNKLNIIVGSSHQYLKNAKGLLNAIKKLEPQDQNKIKVSWYGDSSPDNSYKEFLEEISLNKLNHVVSLYSATNQINNKVQSTDIVALFSFHEGLPNILCEAMASGKTIISSNVSDIPKLIDYDQNLIFDPMKISEIKNTLEYILQLDEVTLIKFGDLNRNIAMANFDKLKINEQYLKLMS